MLQLAFLLGEGVLLLVTGGATFIVISRGPGPELLGQYSLVLAWMMLASGIASLGLPEFILREVGRLEAAGGETVTIGLALGVVFALAASLAMAGLVRLVGYDEDMEKALTIASTGLLPLTTALIARAGFVARRQMHLVLVISACDNAIVAASNIALVLTGHGIVALTIGIVVGKGVASVLAILLLHRKTLRLTWRVRRAHARALLRPILTFGLVNLLGIVAVRINTIMLSMWGTMTAVGHYAVANKLTEIALIAPALFIQLLLPRLSRRFETSTERTLGSLEAAVASFFALAIPAGVGVIVFAEPILVEIFGAEFADSKWVLRILMSCFLVECLDGILGIVLRAAGRQEQDLRLYVSHPTVNVLGNFLSIPAFGGVGAAASKLAALLVSSSLRTWAISRDVIALGWLRAVVAKPAAIAVLAAAGVLPAMAALPSPVSAIAYAVACALLLGMTRTFSLDALKASLAASADEPTRR